MEEFEGREEELLKQSILETVSRCRNCHYCYPYCPLLEITDSWCSQGASGIIQSLYHFVKWGEEPTEEFRETIFSCATCSACVEACKRLSTGVDLVDAIEKGRQLLTENMGGPPLKQGKALEYLLRYRNPYGFIPTERRDWIKGLDTPIFSKANNFEVLYYVGCTPVEDTFAQNMAKAIIKLMKKYQIQFGILEDESCCGCPALRTGEKGLFQELCSGNTEQFRSLSPKRIVTTSPHCFDTFTKEYPNEARGDSEIKIQHYTQFFWELIEQGKIHFKSKVEKRVTFHDPCYLGRHNGIYEEPRRILKSIPGIELVEMPRNRENSFCCGGGGGRMWTDFKAEKGRRMANIRVMEAKGINAEILVTACPFCLINLIDGVKSTWLEGSLEVKDLAELLWEIAEGS